MTHAWKLAAVVALALGAAGCNDFLSGNGVSTDPNNIDRLTRPGPLYIGIQAAQGVQFQGQLARNAAMYVQQIAGNSRQQIGFDRYAIDPVTIDPNWTSVYGSNRTLNGGGTWGGASGLTLDGTDDYVKLPNNIMAGLSSITVSTEVYIEPTQATPGHDHGGAVATTATIAATVHNEPPVAPQAQGPQQHGDAGGGGEGAQADEGAGETLPYWPSLLPELVTAMGS